MAKRSQAQYALPRPVQASQVEAGGTQKVRAAILPIMVWLIPGQMFCAWPAADPSISH